MHNGRKPENFFMRKIKVTKTGLEELKKECEELKKSRPEAVRELTRARELGDLSENSLYHAAKARLRSIDSRIIRLENQIKLAQIIQTRKFLVEHDGREVEYQIVGDLEANPSKNQISENSPIGSALLYALPGETVEIQTPKGKLSLKILKVL